MKKLLPRQKNILLHRSRKVTLRRQRDHGKRFSQRHPLPDLSIATNTGYKPLKPPADLDFDENQRETIKFLERIKRWTIRKRLNVFIDLANVEEIAPEAALVLAAEVQRSIDLREEAVNGRNPRKSRPTRLLQRLGRTLINGIPKEARI